MNHRTEPARRPPPNYPLQPQPDAPPKPAGPGFVEHLRRVFTADVRGLPGSAWEYQQLMAAGVVEPRVQALLAWRRSCLLVALPVLALSVLFAVIDSALAPSDGLTGFGVFLLWLPLVGLLLLPVGAGLAVARWTELRRSSRTLIVCWAVSIALPILVALMPADSIIDAPPDSEGFQVARLILAIGFSVGLLPVLVTVPAGVMRGASRVKSLFPASTLPGWFLVTVAPFYSMFLVVAFVLMHQLTGDALLMLAIGLFAAMPWIFVIRGRTYTRPMSAGEAATELGRAAYVRGGLLLLGSILLLVFLATAEVGGVPLLGDSGDAVLSYYQVIRTAGEVFARGIVATVVFCLLFVNIVHRDWSMTSTLPPAVKHEHDAEMHALDRYAR